MQRWEYLTEILYADVENKGFAESFRNAELRMKNPPRYAVQTTIPRLNYLGEEGWELVHMEPIPGVGTKGDIHFPGAAYVYSNSYFCVFKRSPG
jgi:hypothetical protein